MMRVYQGVDIVDIAKLRGIMLRNRDFISEMFTEQEKAYCEARKDPYLHFAGRFAAKESYLKALGTGFSGVGIDHIFQEIEVRSTASGKPQISVSGWAAKITQKKKIHQCSVSISHASPFAVATVVLLGT